MALSDLLAGLVRGAEAMPTVARLYEDARAARDGDQAAARRFLTTGLLDAADLYRPGSRAAAIGALESLARARASLSPAGQDIVEGEWRDLDAEDEAAAIARFARWLDRRTWGTFVVLGPPGSGKTLTAIRLAERWHQQLGYPVDVVNGYRADLPDWAGVVTIGALQARMQRLADWMESLADADPTVDEWEEIDDEPASPVPGIEGITRRIVIVEEASLAGATAQGGRNGAYQLIRQLMAHSRHLATIVLYVGQLARMLPLDALNCAAVFVKRPNGRELATDRPESASLWDEASAGFSRVRAHSGWQTWPATQAWSWVDSPEAGYVGLFPLSKPGGF